MPRRALFIVVLLAGAAAILTSAQGAERQWLAGDSHIHSHWSPGYDRTKNPPEPLKGQDAIYSTPTNAAMAKRFGLAWMVTTDHGGPNHSKLNLDQAYAELQQSRSLVPEVLQFYGMELNMPAMDHHTLIIPNSADEARSLYDLESRFDANEAWPDDPERDSEVAAARAVNYMKDLPRLPLMFANHPSRSAKGVGEYGQDEPREFRAYNDLAPNVYHGMEGAPGHQAGALARDGSIKRTADGKPTGSRGAYGNDRARTFGGFDQMTAIVGGLWDTLLGEGRRFSIVATSDSHAHYADPVKAGSDFWPGEYQKTYVYARRSFDDVLDGLRAGRIFAVAGDLVNELDVVATADGASATIGGTLSVARGRDVSITVRFRDPDTANWHADNPKVARFDVIAGNVHGPAVDRNLDRNDTAKVLKRVTQKDWTVKDGVTTFSVTLPGVQGPMYVRTRGTNTLDLEPPMDSAGEDPWLDLWVYSNPIFIDVR